MQICCEERALMQLNGCDYEDAKTDFEDENWLVLTDSDATTYASERIDEWVEDEVYNMAEHLKPFFDKEGYGDSLYQSMGRGEFLAPDDYTEHEETVEGVTYFLYKQ